MSSVILNPRRSGWEAAALLRVMMSGEKVPHTEYFTPPVGISVRQSTDVLAVSDPQIAKALRFIHEHACDHIGVKQVLQHCPMARRALETRCQKLLGRTPREEIVRVKLNRVKELLLGTRLPVAEIAERTGFDPQHISVVFKQNNDLTPNEFRRKFGTQS
jgi:LacI family transcriptional regulator